MTPGRRTAIVAGVAGGVLGAGALGAWLVLPGLMRDEAVSRIERRTGLRCEIDDVDVGFSEVVLRGVSLHDDLGALDVELASVSLDAGAFSLAAGGLAAVTAIEIDGGDVRARTGAGALARIVDREPARDESGGASAGPGSQSAAAVPTIVARQLAVALADEHGDLFRAAELDVRLEDDRVVLDVRRLAIAPDTAESTWIDEIHIEANRAERELHTVRASGVRVEVSDTPAELPGVLARARAARSGIGGALDREGGEEAAGDGPLRWLGADFQAALSGLTVRRGTPEGPRDVLAGLDLSLERVSAIAFRTRGQGRPDGGGELAWDLRIEPVALRAEGSIDLQDVALAVIEPMLPSGLPLHRPEEARLTGSVRIEGHGDELEGTGTLAVRDLALAHPRIAPEPIRGIAFGIDGQATFRPGQRRLEIARLRIDAGAAHADVQGAIEWAPEHYLFDLEARLPTTRCDDAIGAIPRDLLQEMSVLSMSGSIGGRIQARIDSRELEQAVLVIRVADGCRFEMVPPIADLVRFEAPFVHRVEEPDGSIFEMETGPGTQSWVPITSISPFFVHAVLGHEDGGFFRHDGFSPWSIREALVRNLRAGRYVMGASTISMQLVKNVFLHREKTLARKVQEVLLTWWIESAWPKDRILELYLNVIEYGPGVYGIRNASRHYFGVEPAALSPAQAAYLANILPNPKQFHAHYEAGAISAAFAGRVTRFIRLMGERERFDAVAVEEAIAEIGALRFHREGEPPPAFRTFRGRTGRLPIEAAELGLVEAQWEAFEAEGAGPGAPSVEPRVDREYE